MSSIYSNGGGSSGSATPAGSSGQLQFNDGGTPAQLAADSNLFWNNDTEKKHLGIQVGTTVNATLHVGNSVGETVTTPTAGSATLVSEVALTAPTGSITQISELPASAGVTASQNLAGNFFTANGQTFDYSIQAVIQQDGVNFLSTNNAIGSYTDTINDGTTVFSNDVSWTAVTNATHYVVYRQINGGGYTAIKLVATNSYNDNGADVAPTTTGWPSYYVCNVAALNTPVSFDTATQNLAGTYYTANGQTILYGIDSYRTANGVKYSSGSPVSGSFTDTINDATTLFSVDVAWTAGGGQDGFIFRRSEDGGATWIYADVGNVSSANDNGFADDGSGTVWSNPFSGFTGFVFSFRAFANHATPNGASGGYYSNSYNTYSTTIPNDNVPRILLHTLSGGSTNAKVTDLAFTVGKKLFPQSPFYDPGINNGTVWADGTTVTPAHYGFTGTDLNRIYRIYGYKTINGLTFYSSSYKQVSVTDPGSGYDSVTIAYTIPSGADGVKILRSINGGAYDYKIVLSSGTSIIDEALLSNFSTGSLGVTPTAYYHTTGRFDRPTDASTDPAIIEAISIAASGQWSKIRLGYAASSATANTTKLVDLLANSSGDLWVDSASGVLFIGDGSTYTTKIGAGYVFNQTGANYDFQYKGQNNSGVMYADASDDTVYFGSTTLNASVAAAVGIRPYADTDSCLVLERRNAQSADVMQIRNNGSFVMAGFNSSAYLFLPNTGSSTTPNIINGTGGIAINQGNFGIINANNQKFEITSAISKFYSNSVILQDAALSTSATAGFTYIPTCAGAPSGTPATQTGTVAMVYDTTNNQFYCYNSTWKKVTLT